MPEPAIEVLILGGDGQTALAGATLPEPLEVRVQESATGKAVSGLIVEWSAAAGNVAVPSPGRGATDDQGIATTTVTLGSALGEYAIQALVEGRPEASVTFTASATLPPEITGLSAAEAEPGASVVVSGRNFSARAADNVILFSGIRGAVTSASSTQLTVTVPACLPPRPVTVVARLGSLASSAHDLTILEGGTPTELQLGGHLSLADVSGLSCTRLSGDGGREYLAVVSSSSQVAAARWPYSLTTLAAGVNGAVGAPAPVGQGRPSRTPAAARPWPGRRQQAWDQELRRREIEHVRGASSERPPAASRVQARVPQVGERSEFSVLNTDGGFTRVTAEAVHVSDHAAIYLDVDAPVSGLTAQDFTDLASDFDDPIFPTILSTFGSVSDLDASERVSILFTPVVNELTERGADGFIGGFFFGLDLLVGRDNSNEGELFYALVPDPDGVHGDPRSRDVVLEVIPAILAHEFQHMVHFNERILVLGGEAQEAAWLSEALAQSSEDVVGDAFAQAGESAKSEQYKRGNWIRAERYLADPGEVSLIVTQGVPTLAERGGGWLFLRYARDQRGSTDLFGQLTRSTRTGVANVVAVTGASWESQLPGFSAALYLDGLGLPVDDALTFPDLELRSVLGMVSEAYPLGPTTIGAADDVRADELWSSSADYFVLRPGSGRTVALSLAGSAQGPADPLARTHLTLVRIR